MISFFRGPGGACARIGAELVPLLASGAVAGSVLPFVGVLGAIAAGLLICILASLLLRAIRGRPRLRRIYRVALVAHVAFWSFQGVRATVLDPPGSPEIAGASTWADLDAFRAGYAEAAFDLPPHTTLAGWGARPRRLTFPPFGGLGVLGRLGRAWMAEPGEGGVPRVPLFRRPDPKELGDLLGARAVVIRPESVEGPPIAIVRLDLVTSDPDLAREVHAGVAELGFLPEGVLVAATHTHSGPGGYSDQPFSSTAGTDHFTPSCFRAIRDAAVAAIRGAHDAAVPAGVTVLRSQDRTEEGKNLLARNRRYEGPDSIDDRVCGLRFDATADGTPIAVLLNYAVHPVIMRRRHMAFDRDLAGALEEALQQRLEGRPPVLFLNAATGDVSPQTGPPLPGRTRSQRLAADFADAIAADFARGTVPSSSRLRASAIRAQVASGTPHIVAATSHREAYLEEQAGPLWSGGAGALAAKALALPVNMYVWSLGLPEVRFGFRWDGSAGVVLDLSSAVKQRVLHSGAIAFDLGEGRRWTMLWVPGEATQRLGRAWREQARERGFEDAFVVGFTNGTCAYLTTPEEFRTGAYEARGTLYGEQIGARIGETLDLSLERAAAALDGR